MINNLLKKYNGIPIVAKATIWFVFCSILQKCMALITTPIFSRIMSTEQYGQFSIYNSWLQIFTIITTLRLSWAVFNKGMSKYKDDRDGYTSTMQTLTCILTTIILVVYLIFRKQVNALIELPTFIVLAIFAELYVTPAIDFWSIRKRYEYIYKPVVFRTVLMLFLNTGLGICAVMLSNEKGYARILSCVLVNICFGGVLFVYNLRKGKKLLCADYVKFALTFNLPLLLHYFSQYVLDQFDRIMIQKLVSFSAAGIYSVGYSAGLVMKTITNSLNNALIPWQYNKLEKRQLKELDRTMLLIFAFIGACSVLYSACAPEIMKILADERYYEAVYVIPPIAISTFFTFMYTTFANMEFYYNANKFTMFISMFGAALNVGLNYVCIKLFGYIAAAYTTLICYIIFSLSHYFYMSYYVTKKLGIDKVFSSAKLLLLSLIVLSGGTLVIFLYDKPIIRYAIILIVCVVAYIKRDALKVIAKSAKKKKTDMQCKKG